MNYIEHEIKEWLVFVVILDSNVFHKHIQVQYLLAF